MSPVRRAVNRTFQSLSVRNFRLYLLGQTVSVTGTWVQTLASAWLVLELTHSGFALGLVTAMSFLPILFLGPVGGLVADRFDKRRILVRTQTAFAVLAAVLAVLVLTDTVQVWQIYLISLAQGVVVSLDNPTRQSFVVEMVGNSDLANAISLNSAVMTGTRVLGPAVAALLIARVGIGWCFAINAISYVAVIGGLLAMRRRDLLRMPRATCRPGGTRRGLRYVWQASELRVPLVIMTVVFAMSFNFSVLFPMLVQGPFHGGAGMLGLVFSAMGVGSLAGALLMAHRARPTGWLLAAGGIAFGVTSIGIGLAPDVTVAVPFLVSAGFTSIVFMITGNATIQLRSADRLRGRVMAIYSMVFLGTTAIGGPISGWVGEHAGPRFALVAGGVVAIAMGVVASRSKAVLAPSTEVPPPLVAFTSELAAPRQRSAA